MVWTEAYMRCLWSLVSSFIIDVTYTYKWFVCIPHYCHFSQVRQVFYSTCSFNIKRSWIKLPFLFCTHNVLNCLKAGARGIQEQLTRVFLRYFCDKCFVFFRRRGTIGARLGEFFLNLHTPGDTPSLPNHNIYTPTHWWTRQISWIIIDETRTPHS